MHVEVLRWYKTERLAARPSNQLNQRSIMPAMLKRLQRYESLRRTRRRGRAFVKMFMEYRNVLTNEIMGLPLKMADILDASINLNPVTGVKRQCAVEKRALDIYDDSLDRVCKLAGNLMKARKWKN